MFSFKFKSWNTKFKDKNTKCVDVSLNEILYWKHEKNITWSWWKLIPKTNVEQTKDNMKGIIFIYTLSKIYLKQEIFQNISTQFKMSKYISKNLIGNPLNYIMDF